MNKLFFAMLLIASAAHAQTNTTTAELDLDSASAIEDLSDERTMLELRVGAGISTVHTSYAPNGSSWALNADLPVSEGSSFNTGLNFAQKGSSVHDIATRINYLVIPFQMKAHFGHARAFRWNIGLGPYVGIKTASYDYYSGANVGGVDNTDIGGRVSFGTEFPLQKRYNLLAGAYYDVGVKTIVDNTRTRSFVVNLGLAYEI